MIKWQKSSYSGAQTNTTCVGLARLGDEIGIQDTNADDTQVGYLTVPRSALAGLLTKVKAGRYDM